ncbi:MFS transporter [Billgrantia tianxiuensis]|jgi:FHS family Na+ dependent glucose MFS transporter 1|uniref:MFS transporter n=1 Tax=Billgrantia tianxiuensis TaxID=2497861 RepID=A0A6I6SUE2_9GAMM|nr:MULTISPECIES: MFS transporter [Halomonas]MCE8033768.1 MFS transporter [Halomonas sp. MCCC 1A11057]QHC51340.1 MFS transporter [Halomonas tianxiuensis]
MPTLDHGRRVTLTYFVAFIAIGMCVGLLGPALPHLAVMTGSGMGQIAILFTARALGTMLGSVFSGLLIDRFDGHRVLAAMLLLLAAGLAAVPFSQALALLTAVMFLLGLAEVSVNAGANTLLLWTHGPASPPWISALHFCFGLGNMLVPLVLVAVLHLQLSFAWAFWLVALYVVLLLLPLLRLPSPRPPDMSLGDRTAPPPQDGWRLAIFLLMFGLYVGMEVTFAGWITAYGVLSGMAPADAALLVTLFWLTLSAGRLLAIPLVRLLTPWMVLRGCLGLGLVSTLALHGQWLPLPLVALLFGLAASAVFPTLFGLSNQLMPANGRTTGWIFLASGIGGMALPSLTGPLLERAGTAAFPLLLVALIALLILGLILLRARVRLAGR